MMNVIGIDQIKNHKLLDYYFTADLNQTASGADEEITLRFDDGKEIIIYINQEGTLCVEGD